MQISWNKKHFYILLFSIRIFSIHNMVAVPLFWETNMAAVTSCENELWHQIKIYEYRLLALIMIMILFA